MWLVGAKGSFSIAYNFWRGLESQEFWVLKIYRARFPFEIRRSTWNFWVWWILRSFEGTTYDYFQNIVFFFTLGGK